MEAQSADTRRGEWWLSPARRLFIAC